MAFLASVVGKFTSFIPGLRLIDGGDCLGLALQVCSAKSGLVALVNGGQPGATLLPNTINEVATVANAADSVALPLAIPGTWVMVYNNTATSMQVFGQVTNPNSATGAGDTIIPHGSVTPAATATGVAQATTIMAMYACAKPGVWKQGLMT